MTDSRHIALFLFFWLAVAGLPARAALDEGFLNQPEPDPVEVPQQPAEEQPDTLSEKLPEKLDEEPPPPDTELRAGVAMMYFDYKESVDAPLKSTETGVLFGPTLAFNHEMANSAIFHL